MSEIGNYIDPLEVDLFCRNLDLFLEKRLGIVKLSNNIITVYQDFDHVSLLLTKEVAIVNICSTIFVSINIVCCCLGGLSLYYLLLEFFELFHALLSRIAVGKTRESLANLGLALVFVVAMLAFFV